MNNKANMFLKISLGIFIWIIGIQFIPFLVSDIDTARTDLTCTDTTISFGTKLICLNIDLIIPFLIWTLSVIVLGVLIGK